MKPNERNLGQFSLSRELLIGDIEAARNVMSGVVVLHSEANFAQDHITYTAHHPDFDLIPVGATPPTYEAIASKGQDGKISVEWRRTANGTS